MPHLGHAIARSKFEVIDVVLTGELVGVLAMSSRSGIGLRGTCRRGT